MNHKNNQKLLKKLERVTKGGANHWRACILFTLEKNSGLSVEGITREVGGNFVTVSAHLQSLVRSGLVSKKYKGKVVQNFLTRNGSFILTFYRMLE